MSHVPLSLVPHIIPSLRGQNLGDIDGDVYERE
jgi:hypothetical protein